MSCAAFNLARITVHSTACAVANQTTSLSPPARSDADAASHAAIRRTFDDVTAGNFAGEKPANDMADCLARFRTKWNQVGVKIGRKIGPPEGAIRLPHRGADAIPRP